MQTDFLSNRVLFVSLFQSGTYLMHRIKNAHANRVLKNSLGDQGTWLPFRLAVTYFYTLPQPSVAEHLAHPIASSGIKGSEDPRQWGSQLKGPLKNLWRYRCGDYRILCQLQDNVFIVLVLEVGPRKSIYRK